MAPLQPWSTRNSGGGGGRRVLVWDDDTSAYILASGLQEFVGPTDPLTVDGLTVNDFDAWTPTT